MFYLALEVRSQDEPTNPRVVKYRWRLLAVERLQIPRCVSSGLTSRSRALSLAYDSNSSSRCGVEVSTRYRRSGETAVRIRALYCALFIFLLIDRDDGHCVSLRSVVLLPTYIARTLPRHEQRQTKKSSYL